MVISTESSDTGEQRIVDATRPDSAPILIHKPGPLFDETPARRASLAGVYRRGLEEEAAHRAGLVVTEGDGLLDPLVVQQRQ